MAGCTVCLSVVAPATPAGLLRIGNLISSPQLAVVPAGRDSLTPSAQRVTPYGNVRSCHNPSRY